MTDSLSGLHVYMGGVGLQQLFIIVFCILVTQVLLTGRREMTGTDLQRMKALLYAIFTVLGLISVRFHVPMQAPKWLTR